MNVLAAQTMMPYLNVTLYSERASSNDWAQVLATFSLFRKISRRRLRKLVRHATLIEFARGETVVARDDPADLLYIVLGGIATARGGSTVRALQIGDYFGDAGLVGGGSGESTVVATGGLHVMRLPLRTYLRFAQHRPAISFAMLRNLGGRLRRLEPRAAGAKSMKPLDR